MKMKINVRAIDTALVTNVCRYNAVAARPVVCMGSSGWSAASQPDVDVRREASKPASSPVSNVMPKKAMKKKNEKILEASEAKKAMELEVKALLAEDNGWHLNNPDVPDNMICIESEEQLKDIVMNSSAKSAVVVDFFSPGCNACKAMWPKLKKTAAQNSEITFAKVDASNEALRNIVEGLKVTKLPWFLIFEGSTGNLMASFTANLSTFDVLRAEISSMKKCTDKNCNR